MMIATLLFVVFGSAIASAANKPMALSKENVAACALRMQHAIESVTTEDQQKMIGDVAHSKQIISRMIVEPVTDAGYDFEETVLAIAGQITNGRIPQDPEHASSLGFILVSIANSSHHLVSYGLMSSHAMAELNKAADYFIQKH